MKKSYNPISDVRNESVELTRRLYRSILDVARHLDDRRGRSQTCSDLFSSSLEAQRVKLREYCERLIFSDPVGYGKKGEELLWRKGYYDVVTTAKRLRKNNSWSALEVAYMQSHLAAGVGHYHHLLFRLQIEFKLDLRGVVDFSLLVNDAGLVKDKSSTTTNKADASSVEWAKQSVHRCLVYLGDLSRYILDLHPNWDSGLAARYYLQAQNMNTEIGMPHNQLGTLSGTRNFGLDAAYHYMRCLICKQSFEGAEGNLQRLLHKSAEWLEENPADANSQPSEHIHRLVAHFLVLADTWFFNKQPLPDTNQVYHEILLDLQQCLLYSKPFPGEGELKEEELELEKINFPHSTQQEPENPTYLTDEIAFKMVVISLLCTSRLNAGSHEAAAAVAFTLAAFSQLIQQVIHHVQDSVLSLPLPPVESPPINSISPTRELRITIEECNNVFSKISTPDASQDQTLADEHSTASEPTALVNGCDIVEKKKKKVKTAAQNKKSNMLQRLRRRRRRRRPRLNSSEESDLSDGDFPFDECSSSDDGNSDISESLEPHNEVSSSEDEEDDDAIDDEDDDEDEEEEESSSNKSAQAESHKSESKIMSNGDLNDHKDINKCNGVVENGECCKDNVITSEKINIFHEASPVTNANNDDLMHKALDPANILELVVEEGLLNAVKVCADWLQCDPSIIKSCGHSSRPLLLRIITLLNLIRVDAALFYKGTDNGHLFKLKNFEEIFNKVPLPEDITLKGVPILKNIHEQLDWDFLRHHHIHPKEEALLRVCKLVEFGHFLTTIPETGVTFDQDQKLFKMCNEMEYPENKDGDHMSLAKTLTNEENGVRTEPASSSSSSSRRGQLMHHMGQLWLRAEVRDLESRVRRRGATYSPYLAVDSDALIHHMHLVKQLVGARKFIVLIPAIVVSALDELKREIGKARETIRWLESQFQRGNRFLRAQRSHERLPLPLMKYPKKKDKEAWLFFQVVECCHYFSQQTGVHERQPETALVTLLTGQKNAISGGTKEEAAKVFSPLGVAKSAGINLEYIESFHSKWKASSKSHG